MKTETLKPFLLFFLLSTININILYGQGDNNVNLNIKIQKINIDNNDFINGIEFLCINTGNKDIILIPQGITSMISYSGNSVIIDTDSDNNLGPPRQSHLPKSVPKYLLIKINETKTIFINLESDDIYNKNRKLSEFDQVILDITLIPEIFNENEISSYLNILNKSIKLRFQSTLQQLFIERRQNTIY